MENNKITKVDMVKGTAGLILSFGTGAIISGIIGTTTKPKGKIIKLCVLASGFVIGEMVGEKVVDYVEDKIDKAIEYFKKLGKKD